MKEKFAKAVYTYAKMHRLSFPTASWRAKAPLALVHANIWDPTKNPFLGGKRYFLLFVDDYSRMMWVYFLEKESEAFSHFIQFKALTENQSGHYLNILRTEVAENLQATNSTASVRSMESKENLQQGVHLNKMVSQKEKTAL